MALRWGRVLRHLKCALSKAWKAGMSSQEYVDYLRKHGIRVGTGVVFRDPLHTVIDLTRPCLIEIGNNVDINSNFTIVTHDFGTFVFRGKYNDFVNSSGKVTIGDNIVFGRDVTILKGVTIGNNCIIGAGSIVTKSIPDDSVVVGSPAKVVCSLQDYYKKRKELSVSEALGYARELALIKGGYSELTIEDFSEEWCLFLSKEEYSQNLTIRQYVDYRLKGKVDIDVFFSRPRPFSSFKDFLKAVEISN